MVQSHANHWEGVPFAINYHTLIFHQPILQIIVNIGT